MHEFGSSSAPNDRRSRQLFLRNHRFKAKKSSKTFTINLKRKHRKVFLLQSWQQITCNHSRKAKGCFLFCKMLHFVNLEPISRWIYLYLSVSVHVKPVASWMRFKNKKNSKDLTSPTSPHLCRKVPSCQGIRPRRGTDLVALLTQVT